MQEHAAHFHRRYRLLLLCVDALTGVPMFYISGPMTKRVNVKTVLFVSLISYVLRFIIYAVVKNPWYAMPAEILRGVTFAG